MRIIKRGTPPTERLWQGRCVTCNSEIEAMEQELNKPEYYQRDNTHLARGTCPVCCMQMIFYPTTSSKDSE